MKKSEISTRGQKDDAVRCYVLCVAYVVLLSRQKEVVIGKRTNKETLLHC